VKLLKHIILRKPLFQNRRQRYLIVPNELTYYVSIQKNDVAQTYASSEFEPARSLNTRQLNDRHEILEI